jgi:hypothetical protein
MRVTSLLSPTVVSILAASLLGCGLSGGSSSAPMNDAGVSADAAHVEFDASHWSDGALASADAGGSSVTPGGQYDAGPGPVIPAGTLTAGVWDDNLNFDLYASFLASSQGVAGLPQISRSDRMIVDVTDETGGPIPGAVVTVRRPAGVLFSTITGADGRVLVFPAWSGAAAGEALTISATVGNASAEATAVAGDAALTLVLGVATLGVEALDVALVIDSTGSMGDEMTYLKTEFDSIVAWVDSALPGLSQRWALVVYRDVGDAFEVRSYPFTADRAAYRALLAAQEATGGGDEPELTEVALGQAAALAWRGGATARVLFHVADAPHHEGHQAAFVTALRDLRARGVHAYTVASSGLNLLAEFSMRTTAQVTGGRYLFLTDDSGVGTGGGGGGGHPEPAVIGISCYYVTALNQAMVRMLSVEVTGAHVAPAATEILRSVGNPQDGRCSFENDIVALAF